MPELRLPRDFESNDSTQVGAAYNFQVSKEVKDKLKDLAIYKHTGIYMIIFTAFNLLLARLSGQNEIVTGILGAGRDDESLQNIVGFFVNTMLCKTDVDYADTFDSFLEKTGSGVMEIMQHQDYPIELVLDDLNRRFPEIKVLFNMFNMKETMNAEIAQHEPMHSKNVHNVKFELTLYALEYKNGLEFSIHYRSDIFTKERVEFMMKQFQTILEMISKQPDKPLKEYVFQKKKRKLKREIKN